MNQEYHITEAQTATRTPESRYRGVSYVKPIDAAKEAVSVVDLAERLCGPDGLRRSGSTFVGHCPLPGHEDKSPSFVAYPETERFWCFGCLRGGDVVDLYRQAQGYDERDAGKAAAYLLLEFGYEVPQQPPAWYRKQDRQRHTREAIEETKKNIVRRRLFRHLILPLIDAIEDEEEHARELKRAWSDFRRLTA